MLKTPCFHCKGHRFNPWVGELRSCMLCSVAKKKKTLILSIYVKELHSIKDISKKQNTCK